MTDSNQPNPIEFAADVVSRSGSMTYYGKTHQVSVRLQTPNFLTIQAMAETSGLTRSDMINRVLEAGIYAIRKELTDEASQNLDVAMRRVSGEFMEEVEREPKS
jgi:predicted DNA-binding ribbon-helix-helix protein